MDNKTNVSENNISQKKGTNTISILGLIFTFIMPIVGLILSIIGLNKSKKDNSSKECAIVGVVLSSFFIIIIVLICLIVFVTYNTIIESVNNDCSKVTSCEKIYDDYICTYYDGNQYEKSITCKENQIPNYLIQE